MRITSVTFSIARTMPLQQLTGKPDDQYSNVKPMSSVTVEVAEGDSVKAACELAKNTAFGELNNFAKEFKALFKKKESPAT